MKLLLLLLFAASACVTSGPATTSTEFPGFPTRFTAIQGLSVSIKGEDKAVIASLRRDGHDFHVTFLHPAFQTPLLELKTFGPVDQRTRYFVDKERLPFDPQLILKAIVSLYEGTSFSRAGAPGDESVIEFETEDAEYHLSDLQSFGPRCVFPKHIAMAYKATKSEQVPQVLPRLQIETKDLECN